MNQPTLKAIIFDMDGVIFDSESIYRQSFLQTVSQYHLEIDEDFAEQFVGRSSADCLILLQNLFSHNFDKTERFFADWGKNRENILNQKHVGFKEGFEQLFHFIKKTPLNRAIVTSANLPDVKENFGANPSVCFNAFSYVITIEQVKHPKPNPEPYLLALSKLQLSAADCVVIEDSITGASASVAAGIKTIMLADNIQPDEALRQKLWYVADSHQEIKAFLAQHIELNH